MTITVELPGVESVADVDLNVDNDEGGMSLVAGEFKLKVTLPQVDEENLTAKFMKERYKLIVTLQLL